MEETHTIERALLSLASVDGDHARVLNGVGFNGRDTDFGNSLAAQLRGGRTLSARQRAAAYKMLRTYKVQLLRDWAVDYDKITPPDAFGPVESVTGTLTITKARATLRTSRPHPEVLPMVREIPGRRYGGSADPSWSWSLDQVTIDYTRRLLKAFPWIEVTGLELLDQLEATFLKNHEDSQATDADLDIPGLGGELMPFQRAGVSYAIKNQSVIIGDEMGLGKTVQALATIREQDAFPAVVVVPAVVKLNWERETRKWLPGWNVVVLSGRNAPDIDTWGPETDPALLNAAVYIINYDILSYWLKFLKDIGPSAVVFDESHYLKNNKAARTKAAKKLAQGVKLRLMLTGTPILNRPSELISQLDILGRLQAFGGFWSFAKRYCAATQGTFGWDMSGASHLDELHDRLRAKCYVRRTKDQVLKELPAKRRVTVPMELSNRAEYLEVEADLRDYFRRKVEQDEELKAAMAGLDKKQQEQRLEWEAALRHRQAMQAEALTKIEVLKQECSRLKRDSVLAWVSDFLESGEKLVLFAHHKEAVKGIAEHFDAPSITGDTSLEDRQAAVDRFQSDPDCRLIVLNIQAGGVGITLTAASDVAFIELPWRPGDLDQAEDRCHRIGQEGSVTAWYLLAAETIEEDIAKLIDQKREVVDAATDGKDTPSDEGILNQLLATLLNKEVAA